MGANLFEQVQFQEHIELLRLFLQHREAIADRIEALLNAQRKPTSHPQDQSLLARQFEDCFFARTALTAAQARLRGQLEQAHRAGAFRPRPVHHVYNDLIHPAEMMTRAVYCWQQTHWPGRNGRLHYAHTLFNLYVLRCLQFLSLSLRPAELQPVLDTLWKSSPPNQPTLVRDARWLIPLAQSLITDELEPYFELAQQVAETLPQSDALEIGKAHVRMLGGHLASQIRHYSLQAGVPIHHPSVVVRARSSNALDFALLVQCLVPLLKAYDRALQTADQRLRLDLAGAICQGISSDPELFLHRLDILSAYTMIEHVFIATDGQVAYSPLGRRHVALLEEYRAFIGRLIEPLRADSPRFKPVAGAFSPYGVIFGLPSNLIEHMALKALQHDAETRFSLEDIFDDADPSSAKLAWVNGWRQLPHIDPEVQRQYDYPQQFAEDIHARIEVELNLREAKPTGRLYLHSADAPELPPQYFTSTESQDRKQLLSARQEGYFLVSYETPASGPAENSQWIALKKDLLTEILAAGRDANIAALPPAAAQVLRLMCIDLARVRLPIPAATFPADT